MEVGLIVYSISSSFQHFREILQYNSQVLTIIIFSKITKYLQNIYLIMFQNGKVIKEFH